MADIKKTDNQNEMPSKEAVIDALRVLVSFCKNNSHCSLCPLSYGNQCVLRIKDPNDWSIFTMEKYLV